MLLTLPEPNQLIFSWMPAYAHASHSSITNAPLAPLAQRASIHVTLEPKNQTKAGI